MKKLLFILMVCSLLLAVAVGLPACNKKTKTYEIALVTDVGNIDDKSFNEGAWNGVKKYAEDNQKTYAYYRPAEDSHQSRLDAVGQAIENGAKLVVCPGYLFQTVVFEAQSQHPNVSFLLLDGEPNDEKFDAEAGATYRSDANVHSIIYKEEQSGFLAGYAAVKDGKRKLGFIGGMDVPAVIRFGFGFVQGAEQAATELGLEDGDVEVKYWYSNSFIPSDNIRTKSAQWYSEGTEVIFACGGGLYLSVLESAKAAGKPIIGVDVDQRASTGETKQVVMTSAEKKLTESVVMALKRFYENDGAWNQEDAGKTALLGASDNAVGLPTTTDSWGFTAFTLEDYQDIFAKLVNDTIEVDNAIDNMPSTTKVNVALEG